LLGVRVISAMQMAIVAPTIQSLAPGHQNEIYQDTLLIGANHKMIRCRDFVVREHINPRTHSIAIDTKTVSSAVLKVH
jgi:hypothetical protein